MKKQDQTQNLILLIGLFLAIYFVYELFILPSSFLRAQSTTNVSVSATVTTTVTCNFSTTTTNFGTIDTNAVYTSSPNVTTTVSCNPPAGCRIEIRDQGSGTQPGLWNSTASYLIPSPAAGFPATATLAAGTEGYGIQATTTSAGSGATLSLNPRYVQTVDTVGGLTTTTIQFASSTSPTANREIVITHKAAVSALTPAGNYQDTITYSCLSN